MTDATTRRRYLAYLAHLVHPLGLAAGTTLLAGGSGAANALAGGERAPALALRTAAGEPVLAEGAAPRWRVLYLDFWASWCGPCRQSFPWMNQLHDKYQSAGLRIVAVNLDQKDDEAQAFLKQVPARFALAFDPAGDSARVFGVKAMPSSFLIAPDRNVQLAHRGFRSEDKAELERRIAAALG